MAKDLPVTLDASVIYHIKLTDSFQNLSAELKSLGYQADQKICIVSDTNVAKLYMEKVAAILKEDFPSVFCYEFLAGEASKNTDTVNGVYEFLIQNRFDRHDLLIALGGGVVGDLTGFTAATYLRGIDFIQVPTSLLSQVDSSIGGKTGVDFMQYKNMVGAFYQPKLVYMNLNVLKTLPREQLISGFGEILKHGLIKNNAYFLWMKEHENEILDLEYEALEEMVYQSCLIKRDVVERDPKEKGERALLNFGHTIGHAVEKLSDFGLSHGVCVGLGMAAASYISYRQGNLTKEQLSFIEETLKHFGLQIRTSGQNPEGVLKTTKLDKKMVGNQIKFILLKTPGDAYIEKNLTDEQILEGILYIYGNEN